MTDFATGPTIFSAMTDAEIDVEVALWEATQPPWERKDPIWTLLAYRIARFALDSVRSDLRSAGRRVPPTVRDQLLRSAASIPANIGEGYSRATNRERARFYSYSLGSVREAISWYVALADELPGGTVADRVALLTRIRRLLLGLIRSSAQLNAARQR